MDDSDSSNASNDRTIAQNDNVNIRNVSDTTSMSSDIIDEVIVKINIETGMTNMDDLHEIIHRFHEHDIDNVTNGLERVMVAEAANACDCMESMEILERRLADVASKLNNTITNQARIHVQQQNLADLITHQHTTCCIF